MHNLDTRACAKSKPLSPNDCNQERVAVVSERAREDAIATNKQRNPNDSSPCHKQLHPLNVKYKTSHYHNWRESLKAPPPRSIMFTPPHSPQSNPLHPSSNHTNPHTHSNSCGLGDTQNKQNALLVRKTNFLSNV